MIVRVVFTFGLLVSLTLTGCAQDLKKLGNAQGALNAGVKLPSLPAACTQLIPHASLTLGVSPVVVLKRERTQLNIANNTLQLCARFSASVKENFESTTTKKTN